MSLLAPSSSHIRGSHREHEPLPSLPPSPSPSPTEEEDLASGSAAWKDTRDEIQLMVKKDVKGKGKAREVVDLNQDDDDEDNYGSMTPVRESSEGVSSYPPTTEEEEEARRVEENLRRWELAERQRRKAAREKVAGTTAVTSVVGEVSRRASLLWPGKRASRAYSKGSGSLSAIQGGAHTVLHARNSEDAVALGDLDARAVPSPATSKPGSPIPGDALMSADNPFEPPDSATPLRSFGGSSSGDSAVMQPSSSPPPPTPAAVDIGVSPFDDSNSVPTPTAPKRPTLQVKSVSTSGHPPPQPLGLPPPKTPPPRVMTPGVTSPPGPTPQPSAARSSNEDDDGNEHTWRNRWWTDWLCGCREGPDRGGDDQAGKTNPYE